MKNKTFKKAKISLSQALFVFITGVIMGTVFVFLTTDANVEYNEAIKSEATYSSFDISRRRGHISMIKISFSDAEDLFIKGVCIGDSFEYKLKELPEGTKLFIVSHPEENLILEMKGNGISYLEFDESIKRLSYTISEGINMAFFPA